MRTFLYFLIFMLIAVIAIVIGVVLGSYGAWYFSWLIGTAMMVLVAVAGGVLFDTQEKENA